jgi:hypothetical protein
MFPLTWCGISGFRSFSTVESPDLKGFKPPASAGSLFDLRRAFSRAADALIVASGLVKGADRFLSNDLRESARRSGGWVSFSQYEPI